MPGPFDKVARQLNRDLAVLGGVLVGTATIVGRVVYVVIDTILRHHRSPGVSGHFRR